MPFVQSLLEVSVNASGSSLVLSGSKVVTAGNTVFLAAGIGSATASGYSATDNLGNTYALVKSTINANGFGAHLWRADVTKPGTLTTITITHPLCTRRNAIAVEFSGVSTLRGANSGSLIGTSSQPSAYPGPSLGSTGTYTATDLWLGAFAFNGTITGFDPGGAGDSVAAVEPTPEQQVPGNVGVAFFYYLSDTGLTFRRLVGTFAGAASRDYAAVGAAYQTVPTGPKYNDAPAGTLSLSGTCVDSYTHGIVYTDVAAGSVALAGTSVDSYVKRFVTNDAPSGTVAFTGSAVEKRGRNDAPTGTLALNGSAADVWFIHTAYDDAPAGVISIAGSATHQRGAFDKPTGRLTVVGVRTEGGTRLTKPSGRLRMWGWPVEPTPSMPQPVGIPGLGVTGTDQSPSPLTLRPSTVTNYTVGDVLCCVIVGFSGRSSVLLSQSPADWEHVVNIDVGGYCLHLFLKLADTNDVPAPSFVFDTLPGAGGSMVIVQVGAFRNLDTRDITKIVDIVGGLTDASLPSGVAGGESITTSQNNELVLSLGGRDEGVGYTLVRPPSGFGLSAPGYESPQGDGGLLAWAYQRKSQAGVIPKATFATAPVGLTSRTIGLMVALKPVQVSSQDSTPSGSLSLTGTRVSKHIYTDRPTGSISIAGTIKSESHVERPKPTARLVLSGSVVENWTHTGSVRTGSISLSGQAADRLSHNNTVAGTVTLTGSATDDFHIAIGYDKPIGGIAFSGTVALTSGYNDSQTGDLVLDGLSSDEYRSGNAIDYSDRPPGRLRLSGRAVHLRPPGFSSVGGHIVLTQVGRGVRRQDGRVLTGTTGRKVKA